MSGTWFTKAVGGGSDALRVKYALLAIADALDRIAGTAESIGNVLEATPEILKKASELIEEKSTVEAKNESLIAEVRHLRWALRAKSTDESERGKIAELEGRIEELNTAIVFAIDRLESSPAWKEKEGCSCPNCLGLRALKRAVDKWV